MGHREDHTPNYRTEVVAVPGDVESVTSGTADLGFYFVNHIRRPVTVLTRTGLRIVVPYTPWRHNPQHRGKKGLYAPPDKPCFIIRSRIDTHRDVILDTNELSDDRGHVTSEEARAYSESLQISHDRLGRQTQSWACVEYRIPEEDFDTFGGILFLQNIDLQVSILDEASTHAHPYSITGQRNRDAHQFLESFTDQGLFYGLYIRDRGREYGERYVNVNGSIHKVPVVDGDPDDRDGVYIVTKGLLKSQHNSKRVKVEHYTFEEADEKLGLYRTYNEAITLGKPEERLKRDLEDRRQELEDRKIELEERKQQWVLEEMEAKRERVLLERALEKERDDMRIAMLQYEKQQQRINQLNKLMAAALDRREMIYRREMAILKDILDERGHERRESMEIIKLIPTIITTVATYAALIKKLKSL